MEYILPLFMLTLIVLIVCIRIRAYGGPVAKFLRFFGIAFGPSLVYAAVADDSSSELLGFSLLCALAVEGAILWKERTNKTR